MQGILMHIGDLVRCGARTVNGRPCIRHVSTGITSYVVSVKPLKAKTEIKNGLDRA